MTESGNSKDNAVAGQVNNTITNDVFKGMEFYGIKEVSSALQAAVDFYTNKRPHLSLGHDTSPRQRNSNRN